MSKGFRLVTDSDVKLSRATSSGDIGSNTHEAPDYEGSRTTISSLDGGGGGIGDSLPTKTRRDLGLDGPQIARMGIEDLMDILIDAHPDMSFALWNYNRMAASGYLIDVYDTETGEVSEEGNLLIEELVNNLAAPNPENFQISKDIDKVVAQLIQSVIIRGACALELVPTPSFDDVAFLAPVDPSTIEFEVQQGRIIPTQDGGDIILDIPNFFYEGLDEVIDNPYGRSPVLGAINTIMFQLEVLRDLKAVVHNQGYPRFDITLMEDILLKRMPPNIRNNEVKKQEWLENQMSQVRSMYEQLSPDDSFVHMDSVEINMAGGSGSKASVMIDPEKLMTVIDNQIMGGLKTLSTILGRRSTGNTESFAKIEVKMYTKGVEAVQQVVSRLMSRALTLYLNMRGAQGRVEFKFKPIEIRTDSEIEQFEQVRIQNAINMRDQGWITQDEASRRITGSDAVSEPLRDGEEPTEAKGNINSKDDKPQDVNDTDGGEEDDE